MKKLIVNYLNDDISKEELAELRNWLKKPKNQAYFKVMIKTNHRLNTAYSPIDSEKAYQKVLKASTKKKNTGQKLYRELFKYAAAVVLIGSLFGLYSVLKTETDPNSIFKEASQVTLELEDGSLHVLDEKGELVLTKKQGKSTVTQEHNTITYKNNDEQEEELKYNQLSVPYGKQFQVVLSDGTMVHLNAGTTLKYPVRFIKGQKRHVFLEGEAYFDVSEDKTHPFIVNANALNVTVLGTAFNVTSYPDDNATAIVLVEGSVDLSANKDKTKQGVSKILVPGDKGSFDRNTHSIAVSKVNTTIYTSWMQGRLVFRDLTFNEILRRLERNYNVKIENRNTALGKEVFNASFNKIKIDSVLSYFNEVHKINFTITEDKISID